MSRYGNSYQGDHGQYWRPIYKQEDRQDKNDGGHVRSGNTFIGCLKDVMSDNSISCIGKLETFRNQVLNALLVNGFDNGIYNLDVAIFHKFRCDRDQYQCGLSFWRQLAG